MSARIPYLDATDVEALLTPAAAVDALCRALIDGPALTDIRTSAGRTSSSRTPARHCASTADADERPKTENPRQPFECASSTDYRGFRSAAPHRHRGGEEGTLDARGLALPETHLLDGALGLEVVIAVPEEVRERERHDERRR